VGHVTAHVVTPLKWEGREYEDGFDFSFGWGVLSLYMTAAGRVRDA